MRTTAATASAVPTNFAQGMSVVVSIAIGMEDVLTSIQILTVNLVTSVTLGTVIAFEEPEVSDTMAAVAVSVDHGAVITPLPLAAASAAG